MRFGVLGTAMSSVLTLAVLGCGAEGGGPVASEETGTVSLGVGEAPPDTRCLVVSFDGVGPARVEKFALTPGETASFEARVPVGVLAVDASAYASACSRVSSSSVATYVSEAVETVHVRPGRVNEVALRLIQSGRLGVEVSFQDGDLGGASEPFELAVIGDTPYGATQAASFFALVDAINADASIDAGIHVGDIKNGSTRCDDSYFATIFDEFSRFTVPLLYTPGDNEWTDCHRANNGAYDPLERLDVLRSLFFAEPGVTLGEPHPVLSQVAIPEHETFVENQLFTAASVVFSVVHVVGSENGVATWFGTDTTGTKFDDPDRRLAEVDARIAAAVDWIERSFALAESDESKGLVLFMQADTFIGRSTGFEAVIRTFAERARGFAKPVLLIQGDSHRYTEDRPFENGNEAYEISEPVANVTRIVVEGETVSEWLKLSVDPTGTELFSWERRTLSQ
jgi:hypothetical protein